MTPGVEAAAVKILLQVDSYGRTSVGEGYCVSIHLCESRPCASAAVFHDRFGRPLKQRRIR